MPNLDESYHFYTGHLDSTWLEYLNWGISPSSNVGKTKLSLCLTKHHAKKIYLGSGSTAPCILDLGTWWRLVVSFVPQSLCGHGGEEKNFPHLCCMSHWYHPSNCPTLAIPNTMPQNFWNKRQRILKLNVYIPCATFFNVSQKSDMQATST